MKAYTVDPNTGVSRVMDFDKPDVTMLQQMADVLLNRLDKPSILKMIYLDEGSPAPKEIQIIVADLVAVDKITTWKQKLVEQK